MSLLETALPPAPQKFQAPQKTIAAPIARIQSMLGAELELVNTRLRAELSSDVVLINQIADYLIAAGGKRLRPMLVLLCAKALSCAESLNAHAASLAAIIELIHTATLLHDDVVDESDQRRSRKTANAMWGNAASVLVGDFLYSRSFQMMVRIGNAQVMEVLADTTNTIAEGEVLQLINKNDPNLSQSQYLDVIERKTAVLFAAGCRLGALSAGAHPAQQAQAAEFGMCLGYAFQIADDVLDYTGNADVLGKNLGDDLAEGKATLPLIIARERAEPSATQLITAAIENGDRHALPAVVQIIRATDALDASLEVAEAYAERARLALHSFPDSAAKAAMLGLCQYAVRRDN
jgi:octaprenyl-diphosphate synthase